MGGFLFRERVALPGMLGTSSTATAVSAPAGGARHHSSF